MNHKFIMAFLFCLLSARIGIRSTPTLIFPDGRIIPGYKSGKAIIRLLEKKQVQNETKNP
jgi:predicted DsbA family dithiol-disulfide isomerase